MRQEVNYQKTHFKRPPKINEETFVSLKNEFNKNSNFHIDKKNETFSEHFSTKLIIIVVSFIIMIGGFSLGEGITTAIGGFAMLTFLVVLIRLLLEGPSYATYVKERRSYFERMTYAIKTSDTYFEYIDKFYKK
jgi:hypothetical protein